VEGARAEQFRAEHRGACLGDGAERAQLPRHGRDPIRSRGDLLVAGRRQRRQARLDRFEMRKRRRQWSAIPGVRCCHQLYEAAGQ
jgi:hypothetical protein